MSKVDPPAAQIPQRRTGSGRRRALAMLSVAVLLVAAVAGYHWSRGTGSSAARTAPSPILHQSPSTVSPGMHILGRLAPGVAYVVETSDGLALIDAGLAVDAGSVLQQMGELGLDPMQLRVILLTHVHGDHSLGAKYLRELTGAKIYAGKQDAPPLRAGGPREAFFANYDMSGTPVHATPVDVELSGGEVIDLGGTRFQAIATPGHTLGSFCYLVDCNGTTALFAGDTIMSMTELGSYAAYLAPRYRSDAGGYLRSLRALRAMPAPDLLLPGHPHEAAEPPSARITQQHWRGLLDAGIQEMETLTARYRSDGSDFLDDHPKEILPGLHYLGDFAGLPIYCWAWEEQMILFDAPGGPGLVGFLQAKLHDVELDLHALTAVLLTSCDGEAVRGLRALVEESACEVIAAETGIDAVKKLCPVDAKVHAQEVLQQRRWPMRGVALEGLGTAPMAYQLQWHDKTVLVSGRVLSKLGRGRQPMQNLARRLAQPDNDAQALLRSLDTLARLEVDVWLPAEPVDGQNANVYDQEWAEVVSAYRSLVQQWIDIVSRRP